MSQIAVLDVGKTNKKLLVFDERLAVVDEAYTSIEADESGELAVERVDATTEWFLEQLEAMASKHEIGAISVTTHGATWVGVGADGSPALPVIAYTNEPGEAFARRFYERVGDPVELHRKYATGNFGALVNLAKGIAFGQERFPEEFARVVAVMTFPGYFSFVLTGKRGVECTYAGCHSYLLDFAAMAWSPVVDALGIRALLPAAIARPGDVLGPLSSAVAERTGLSREVVVTHGIHDSNASLLPYLIRHDDPFVLNSTGTWCVAMCPAETAAMSDRDIETGVFCNCDAFGHPARTGIFMGGAEWETWGEAIQKVTGTEGIPAYDPAVYQQVLDAADTFIFPGVVPGTGPFPRSTSRLWERGTCYSLEDIKAGKAKPECFADATRAYAVLNCGVAVQSREQLVGVGLQDGMPIYVEGGFRKNLDYQALLAAFFPSSAIVLTDMKEATAFGSALLGLAAMTGRALEDLGDVFEIVGEPAGVATLAGVEAYRQAYIERVEAGL